jgi:hypothetical protein
LEKALDNKYGSVLIKANIGMNDVFQYGGIVKKLIVIGILGLGLLIVACDKQRALDKILADPQMKTYIMVEIMESEQTRAQIADSLFADRNLTNAYLTRLIQNEYTREDLLRRMMQVDTSGQWTVSILAQEPRFKEQMKQASR